MKKITIVLLLFVMTFTTSFATISTSKTWKDTKTSIWTIPYEEGYVLVRGDLYMEFKGNYEYAVDGLTKTNYQKCYLSWQNKFPDVSVTGMIDELNFESVKYYNDIGYPSFEISDNDFSNSGINYLLPMYTMHIDRINNGDYTFITPYKVKVYTNVLWNDSLSPIENFNFSLAFTTSKSSNNLTFDSTNYLSTKLKKSVEIRKNIEKNINIEKNNSFVENIQNADFLYANKLRNEKIEDTIKYFNKLKIRDEIITKLSKKYNLKTTQEEVNNFIKINFEGLSSEDKHNLSISAGYNSFDEYIESNETINGYKLFLNHNKINNLRAKMLMKKLNIDYNNALLKAKDQLETEIFKQMN
jgi:hypothetical protein